MDHVSTLGGTLEKIAWQKAGIFKVNVFFYFSMGHLCCLPQNVLAFTFGEHSLLTIIIGLIFQTNKIYLTVCLVGGQT